MRPKETQNYCKTEQRIVQKGKSLNIKDQIQYVFKNRCENIVYVGCEIFSETKI